MIKPVIMTILGIRPDIVRMSALIPKLDEHFNNILVHTGQHYQGGLSGNFFREFGLRDPDINLGVGSDGKEHFQQQADLGMRIVELLRRLPARPEMAIFLGDSNSVLGSIPLKKEGIRIGHIEAGMRSGDVFMPEEVNRITIDHISDVLFAYHYGNLANLDNEGIRGGKAYLVGNTIIEPFEKFSEQIKILKDRGEYILVDIHRHENVTNPKRLFVLSGWIKMLARELGLKTKLIAFRRTLEALDKMHGISLYDEVVGLAGYRYYLELQSNSEFVISDSGTAQEECPLLEVPLLVPRSHTERPESLSTGGSIMVDPGGTTPLSMVIEYLKKYERPNCFWLGYGSPSDRIVEILRSNIS